MRALSLDEKISIKGELSKQGVLPCILIGLDTQEAMHLYWVCYGRPVSTHSSPKKWRKTMPKRRAAVLH